MTYVNITIEDAPGFEPAGKVKIVNFAGQLDESNIDDKAKTIYELIENSPQGTSMIFDFAELEYMNSKSIGYLTDWYSKVNEKEGKIVITRAKENILDILDVVGLTQLIECVNTIEAAKTSLK